MGLKKTHARCGKCRRQYKLPESIEYFVGASYTWICPECMEATVTVKCSHCYMAVQIPARKWDAAKEAGDAIEVKCVQCTKMYNMGRDEERQRFMDSLREQFGKLGVEWPKNES